MTEKEKMLMGKIYDPSDVELVKLRENAHLLSKKYNDCFETDESRNEILSALVNIQGDNVRL
jgi:maltose O-acetyltransferase